MLPLKLTIYCKDMTSFRGRQGIGEILQDNTPSVLCYKRQARIRLEKEDQDERTRDAEIMQVKLFKGLLFWIKTNFAAETYMIYEWIEQTKLVRRKKSELITKGDSTTRVFDINDRKLRHAIDRIRGERYASCLSDDFKKFTGSRKKVCTLLFREVSCRNDHEIFCDFTF